MVEVEKMAHMFFWSQKVPRQIGGNIWLLDRQ